VSTEALLNVTSYADGHDFTGDSNVAQFTAEAQALDASTFRSGGWMENAYGAKSAAFNMQGFWQSAATDAVDPELWAAVGAVDRVHTIAPDEVAGGVAYMLRAGVSNYQLLDGGYGQLAKFTMDAGVTAGPVARGMLAKIKGAASATGPLGSGVQLGAVAANQFLYATFHVFTIGTSITVQVESDDNAGFTTPTLRGTIGPLTVRGGVWMTRVAGPLTDTWYRFNVSAVTGAHVVAGAIGIG
jgi:hypothetical protein